MENKKTALVTGASSGFGKEIVKMLAERGYDLILIARRQKLLEALATSLKGTYPNQSFETIVGDVRDFKTIETLIKSNPLYNEIEIVINNAGLARGLSTIVEGSLDDWNDMIDTNIKGVLHVSKICLPILIAKRKGHIVNMSSIAGKEVYANGNVYCASKHALDAITKSLRLETAAYNIRVTSISPGAAETEFSLVRFRGDKERAANVYKGFSALSAIDVAECVLWALERPSHVNISEITVMPTVQPSAGVIIKN
jgi:3-hydroxy acid dehydrogenase/malonic semialdehyde reductase